MPHDIMHILLEGVVPMEIKLLLRHAINELQLFTINWFNRELAGMILDGTKAKDRPSPIDRKTLNSTGHKLNQSGEETSKWNFNEQSEHFAHNNAFI